MNVFIAIKLFYYDYFVCCDYFWCENDRGRIIICSALTDDDRHNRSEWLLLNTNSVIFQPYHGENKLIFQWDNDEDHFVLDQYAQLDFFIVLAHWNNSPRIDISPHQDALSWFWTNQSLLFPLNAACLAEQQQIIVLLTGCFCIGPARSAVLAPRPSGPILLTENLYQGQYRNSQFVTLLLNNIPGPYDRAVWIFFQGRMDKLTKPYEYIDRAVWAWFLRH